MEPETGLLFTKKRGELLIGLFFLLLASMALLVFIPVGVKVPGSIDNAALSPDFWPTVICWLMVVAAIGLIAESRLPAVTEADTEDEGEEGAYKLQPLFAITRTAGLIVVLFGFYLGLEQFGLVVTSIALLAAMMLFFGERNYPLVVGLSFGFPVLLYLFFRYVASVPIPLGILGA